MPMQNKTEYAMKLAVSVSNPGDIATALGYRPDLLELRLDLMPGVSPGTLADCLSGSGTPVILTLRSRDEGGQFAGSPADWERTVEPYLDLSAYVDIEERFRDKAPGISARGCSIIASWHTFSMPSRDYLDKKYKALKDYGDIPKIITVPGDEHDVLSLCRFTVDAEKPLITGTMGPAFRFSRIFLLLFGSWAAFCHCGQPAAPGQFHIRDVKQILLLLQ
jgi:3-dehydroquinate dehydratase-1